jgi:predicted nucleotidyltransferase
MSLRDCGRGDAGIVTDPYEGVTAAGAIRTGARRDRVPSIFDPILYAASAAVGDFGASLYVYGSVANGTARPGVSDVDLLSVDYPSSAELSAYLTDRFPQVCRGVDVAAMTSTDLQGETDEAYGNQVFLRHYCPHWVHTSPNSGPGRTAHSHPLPTPSQVCWPTAAPSPPS